MRKRFMITMDDEDHRALTLEAARNGVTVGEYIGGVMDPIKKGIEQVKVQGNGKLSKGLGTLPGQEAPVQVQQWRPVPKPGKGKP